MSLNAAAIEVLVDRGLSSADILAVARALEADSGKVDAATKLRAAAAERKRRQRDRSRNVTGQSRDSHVTPSPNEYISNPQPVSPVISNEITTAPVDETQNFKAEQFVEAWNELADSIGRPKILKLTPERRVQLKARIAGYTLDEFRAVLGNIQRSPFLRGELRWKGCTFDWVIKKANFQKILEGNYDE